MNFIHFFPLRVGDSGKKFVANNAMASSCEKFFDLEIITRN